MHREPHAMSTTTEPSLHALAVQLAASATWPAWLAGFRARALRTLDEVAFPQRKSESWKYSSLAALEGMGALARSAQPGDDNVPDGALPALDAWRIVFVNGRLDTTQSVMPDDGSLDIHPLIGLPEPLQARASELLGLNDSTKLPFTALNSAAFTDGLFVQARKGAAASKPLHVVFHGSGAQPASAQARLLVDIEPLASLTLVEQYTSNATAMFTNAATTIAVARDARLTLARVQFEGAESCFVGSLHLRLAEGSRCDGYLLMTGSRLKRNDITCHIAGAGAELALKGVYLVGRGEHADNQVCIEHAVPHGSSEQQFRGIVGGDGRGVFNGRIHIHPGARQTSAELVNNNLLLSADAEIDTKPELEIYNDDVKCSHGATVGQLNEAGVFYLQSRGIARADAELMLSLGFVNALLAQVPVPGLAEWLRSESESWFASRSGRGATA
jgi:Fe-S cluster assembly protein SufD